MATRTVLLLRHAQAGDPPPGGSDMDRRLTAYGEEQARAVGAALTESGVTVDAALCSPAVRTRQTLELLGLSAGQTDLSPRYYNAGADTLIDALRELPLSCRTALLVGHAPGVPSVAYELADPDISDPVATVVIEARFPTGTLARLEFTGDWADLETAALVSVHLP